MANGIDVSPRQNNLLATLLARQPQRGPILTPLQGVGSVAMDAAKAFAASVEDRRERERQKQADESLITSITEFGRPNPTQFAGPDDGFRSPAPDSEPLINPKVADLAAGLIRGGNRESGLSILNSALSQALKAKDPGDPFTLSPGQTRFGPQGREVASVPGAVAAPKATGGVILNPDGSINEELTRRSIEAKRETRPVTSVTTNLPKAETEFDKEIGKAFAGELIDIRDSAKVARRSNTQLNLLRQLSEKTDTGALAPTVLGLRRVANSLGIPAGDTGPAELMQSITNELTLGAAQRLTGPITEKELGFLTQIQPSLATSEEGIELLIETNKRLNDRSILEAKLAADYARENNGRLDLGFEAVLADLPPVFDDDFIASLAEVQGSIEGVEPPVRRPGRAGGRGRTPSRDLSDDDLRSRLEDLR